LIYTKCTDTGNREEGRGGKIAIALKAISQLVTGNREQGTAAETDNMN
jgi:hypothetical protein